MKVCEQCKIIYNLERNNCSNCGSPLIVPEKTDAFLKEFLEIDDATLNRFKEIQQQTIAEAQKMNHKDLPLKAIGISGSHRDQLDMAVEASNSEFLLKEALKELEEQGVKTELLPLRKYNIKPCKCCYSTTNAQCHFYCSCYQKETSLADDMTDILYDKILEADIVLFATPVNNFKISSLLATFIDRCISLDGSLTPADPKKRKNKELNIKHTKFIQLTADQNIPGSGFLRRFMGKSAGIIVTGHEEGASMAISQLFMTLNHFGMIFSPWSNMYAMSSVTDATYTDKPTSTDPVYIEEARMVARNALSTAKLIRQFNNLDWQHDYSSN